MADLKVYNDADIKARLEKELPGWSYDDNKIQRLYKTADWRTTMMLVNALAYVAEAADHHPDLEVSWGKVRVKLNTHSAGGVTDMDFQLAQKIEQTALWRPAQDSVFKGGTTQKWVEGA